MATLLPRNSPLKTVPDFPLPKIRVSLGVQEKIFLVWGGEKKIEFVRKIYFNVNLF
jgi:hypothetical protein